MTKKIIIPCVIGGVASPTEFLVGSPAEGADPIAFQTKWFASAKKGSVSPEILNVLKELYAMSLRSKVSFEDLCVKMFEKK
jgi:hypothetical protein